MTDEFDFELSLRIRPHRSYGTLFVLDLVDLDAKGDGNWGAQSESERHDKTAEDLTIDTERPHEHVSITRESVALLRRRLRELTVTALPAGPIGFGGTTYELRARDGSTEVAFAWWGELPEGWAGLAAIVAFLRAPNDANRLGAR
ncbi:MAG: hypothetical protein QM820_23655 [Minicystis sp.]